MMKIQRLRKLYDILIEIRVEARQAINTFRDGYLKKQYIEAAIHYNHRYVPGEWEWVNLNILIRSIWCAAFGHRWIEEDHKNVFGGYPVYCKCCGIPKEKSYKQWPRKSDF